MTVLKDPEGRELQYLRKFGAPEGKRVLEIGVGEGRLVWEYAATTRRVVGIDTEREALQVARVDQPSDVEDRAHMLQAEAEHLPFRSRTFDLAIFAWSF